jgi:hypothetical protein
VLQDVEGHHQVEAGRGDRQPGGVTADHRDRPFRADLRAVGAELQRRDLPAQPLQDPGVTAAGRTDVHGSAGGQIGDRASQQASPLAVPPVPVLERGQLADLGRLHAELLQAVVMR